MRIACLQMYSDEFKRLPAKFYDVMKTSIDSHSEDTLHCGTPYSGAWGCHYIHTGWQDKDTGENEINWEIITILLCGSTWTVTVYFARSGLRIGIL